MTATVRWDTLQGASAMLAALMARYELDELTFTAAELHAGEKLELTGPNDRRLMTSADVNAAQSVTVRRVI